MILGPHERNLKGVDVMDRLFGRCEWSPSGCWLYPVRTQNRGYSTLYFDGRTRRAHIAAWEIVNGPVPSNLYVCHRCDVRNCVNPAHLFLGTPRENSLDAKRKGRLGRLRDDDVREIRRRRASGELGTKIAADLGVSPAYVYNIARRVQRTDVTEVAA